MRTITDHKVNGLNEALEITAGEPGPGGASHRYDIIGKRKDIPGFGPDLFGVNLRFQNGPISKPEDMNGITNEALLAVLIDRMRGFQYQRLPPVPPPSEPGFDFNSRGKFACRENAVALTHLEEALMWLQKRTRDRMARGVEGSHTP